MRKLVDNKMGEQEESLYRNDHNWAFISCFFFFFLKHKMLYNLQRFIVMHRLCFILWAISGNKLYSNSMPFRTHNDLQVGAQLCKSKINVQLGTYSCMTTYTC